nr:WD repeat-containing protein 82-B [Ipomoea batatas]
MMEKAKKMRRSRGPRTRMISSPFCRMVVEDQRRRRLHPENTRLVARSVRTPCFGSSCLLLSPRPLTISRKLRRQSVIGLRAEPAGAAPIIYGPLRAHHSEEWLIAIRVHQRSPATAHQERGGEIDDVATAGGGGGQPEREDRVSLELNPKRFYRAWNRRLTFRDYLYFPSNNCNILLKNGMDGCLTSMCSRKECFISLNLIRTVMLWDQRAEKCQEPATAYDEQGLVFAICFCGYRPIRTFSVVEMYQMQDVVKFRIDWQNLCFGNFRWTRFTSLIHSPMAPVGIMYVAFCKLQYDDVIATYGTRAGFVTLCPSRLRFRGWQMSMLESVRSAKKCCWMSTISETLGYKMAPGSLMYGYCFFLNFILGFQTYQKIAVMLWKEIGVFLNLLRYYFSPGLQDLRGLSCCNFPWIGYPLGSQTLEVSSAPFALV